MFVLPSPDGVSISEHADADLRVKCQSRRWTGSLGADLRVKWGFNRGDELDR